MKDQGIISWLNPPYAPQHYGMAKRRNCTLLDIRYDQRCVFYRLILLGYALETADYLLDRVLSISASSTPYGLWYTRNPSSDYVKPWGYSTLMIKQDPSKLEILTVACKSCWLS